MKILACLADHFGCGNARIEVPYNALRKLGHEVIITDMYRWNQTTLAPIDNPDIIVLQRPGNLILNKVVLEGCKKNNIPIIIELDDLLWDIPSWNPSYWEWLTPKKHKEPIKDNSYILKKGSTQTIANLEYKETVKENNNLNVLKNFIANADACTLSTQPLANEIHKLWPKKPTYVLHNCLELEKWPLIDHKERWERTKEVVVGWGGSGTHLDDLKMLKGSLGRTVAKYDYAKLQFFGASKVPYEIFKDEFPSDRLIRIGWVEGQAYRDTVSQLDIGLAPVTNHRFNESKSDLKVVEYSACAIAPIASDLINYRYSIQNRINGYLVKTPADWIKVLDILLTDHGKRIEMGLVARCTMAEQRDISKNVYKWEQCLQEVIEKKKMESKK
jgi:glycosyltransferase involved in cell wall biosynthesis